MAYFISLVESIITIYRLPCHSFRITACDVFFSLFARFAHDYLVVSALMICFCANGLHKEMYIYIHFSVCCIFFELSQQSTQKSSEGQKNSRHTRWMQWELSEEKHIHIHLPFFPWKGTEIEKSLHSFYFVHKLRLSVSHSKISCNCEKQRERMKKKRMQQKRNHFHLHWMKGKTYY